VYAPWNDIDNGKHHPVKVSFWPFFAFTHNA